MQEAFFFSSRRRHTRFDCDWSSDVCSSDLTLLIFEALAACNLASHKVFRCASAPCKKLESAVNSCFPIAFNNFLYLLFSPSATKANGSLWKSINSFPSTFRCHQLSFGSARLNGSNIFFILDNFFLQCNNQS